LTPSGRPKRAATQKSYEKSQKIKSRQEKLERWKAEGKTRRPAKPVALSAALAEIVGTNRLPRGQVSKQIWVYIKANNLQDPKDKRRILLDDKMKAVFGENKKFVTMFNMNRALTDKHMFRIEKADLEREAEENDEDGDGDGAGDGDGDANEKVAADAEEEDGHEKETAAA